MPCVAKKMAKLETIQSTNSESEPTNVYSTLW